MHVIRVIVCSVGISGIRLLLRIKFCAEKVHTLIAAAVAAATIATAVIIHSIERMEIRVEIVVGGVIQLLQLWTTNSVMLITGRWVRLSQELVGRMMGERRMLIIADGCTLQRTLQ